MNHQLELINPPELGKHPGYSHAVKVQTGSLLFISGQVGWDETGTLVSSDFVAQFEQALANVVTALRAAGGKPENLVRLTVKGEKVTGEERLLKDLKERIRDVVQGPDGALYLLTDNAKGRVVKLVPRKAGA